MAETEKCSISLPVGWANAARSKGISLSGVLRKNLAPDLDLTDEEIRRYGSAFRIPSGKYKVRK